MSIITWQRVDEILAGATIALLYHNGWLKRLACRLPKVTTLVLATLIVVSSHSWSGALMYARPYFAGAAVGVSIFAAPAFMRALFVSKPAAYVAAVSYALYVFHGMLSATWLASGDTLVKYAKRPLLFAATFGLAHLSTFQFEARMIALGKLLSKRISLRGGKVLTVRGARP